MPRPRSSTPRSAIANVRLTEEERRDMETLAAELGHGTLSEYVRVLHQKFVRERQSAATTKVPVSLAERYP